MTRTEKINKLAREGKITAWQYYLLVKREALRTVRSI